MLKSTLIAIKAEIRLSSIITLRLRCPFIAAPESITALNEQL